MHILFINPHVSQAYFNHVERIARMGWQGTGFFNRDIRRHERFVKRVFYGLGLLTLASGLPRDIGWSFVDENLEERDLQDIYEQTDYDLVALSGQVIQSGRTLELIRYFTRMGKQVVVGGVHATGFWEDYLHENVSVIVGEGEALFNRFLADFTDHRPRPLYRQRPEDCIDLQASPVPDFSAIAKYRYNLVGVQTTRGCPYRCRYCSVSTVLGETYRHKPVERVREEVLRVKKIWPGSMFYFYDDNLFGDNTYAMSLFEALHDIDLGPWGTHADISISRNPELLEQVTGNGKPFLAIGFETLSPKNAATLGNQMKADMLSRYDEGVALLKSTGIDVAGSFMFGFPGDSEATLHRIVDFTRRHAIRGYITRYTVIPGSRLYEETLAEYEAENGPLEEKGTERARLLNVFFMRKNGFTPHETEDMIIRVLKETHKTGLPLPQIDALAVFRSFFADSNDSKPFGSLSPITRGHEKEPDMFTKLPESEGAALGVRLSGKITTEMEEELINVCNQVIEEHNTIDVLVHLDEHARWGVKAGIEDLKWALTHIKNIGKVAIVADSQFYKWYVALNQPFAKMVGIQEEYFKPDAIDEAWAWVKG